MVVALLSKKREAIKLRKAGLPYSDIRKKIGVSKSSLSNWLRGIELSGPNLRTIASNWIARRVATYRDTVKKRISDLEGRRLEEAKRSLNKISKRDLLVAGLFLYLGEGTKHDRWSVCITNSNPEVVKFARKWLTDIMGVPRKKIRIKVHLYKDMNARKELAYWSKITKIPLTQFRKPYIKKTLRGSVDFYTHGHGTCNIMADNGPLKQRIMAEIQIILNFLNDLA
ncbi:MAG: hypothetical protein IT514_16480 [Burkholderiales bacterium]|nr:hypothetical protein [Burkholderiales bacterium]